MSTATAVATATQFSCQKLPSGIILGSSKAKLSVREIGFEVPVICKSKLVALAACIDDPCLVQVEEVGVVIPVIRLAAPISFRLRD